MIALTVGERAQRVHVRLVGTWDRQTNRLGAGRQQQAGRKRPCSRRRARPRPPLHIDAGDLRLEPQLDAVLGIEAVRPQRHPILRRIAGEIILGEIRPVDRRRIVVAQHDDASLILLAPELLGRGKASRAAADDHDFFRRSSRRLCRAAPARLRQLLAHENLAVAPLHRQHATGLKAGACRASPVRRSKQA